MNIFSMTNLVALKWSSVPKNLIINDGERIEIKCSADGNPKPNVKWFKLNEKSSKF